MVDCVFFISLIFKPVLEMMAADWSMISVFDQYDWLKINTVDPSHSVCYRHGLRLFQCGMNKYMYIYIYIYIYIYTYIFHIYIYVYIIYIFIKYI